MTNESILEAVHAWAKEKNLSYEARISAAPPAALAFPAQTEAPDSSGVFLKIGAADPDKLPPSFLEIWIPQTGKNGSTLTGRGTEALPTAKPMPDWFHCTVSHWSYEGSKDYVGSKALRTQLNWVLWDFLQDYVYGPVLEQWLSEKGIKFGKYSFDILSGTAAVEYDPVTWHVLECEEPTADGFESCVVGVCGSGYVSRFAWGLYDHEGWLFEHDEPDTFGSPAELVRWLEQNISQP